MRLRNVAALRFSVARCVVVVVMCVLRLPPPLSVLAVHSNDVTLYTCIDSVCLSIIVSSLAAPTLNSAHQSTQATVSLLWCPVPDLNCGRLFDWVTIALAAPQSPTVSSLES